jgi:hypothetical protein
LDDVDAWPSSYALLQADRRLRMKTAGLLSHSRRTPAAAAEEIASHLAAGKSLEEACALVFDDPALTRRQQQDWQRRLRAALAGLEST